jgi:ubiquinone/menaquinone biosynthesis C-methylase UbiE
MAITNARGQVYADVFEAKSAENYERWFVPVIGRPLAADLVEEARLRPGERVLDVACGTGIVTRLAADRVAPGGTVAGADVNPGMLALAHRLAASAPVPVQWYETAAEAMPLPDGAFDIVFCQLGLMFMTDRRAALREMRRVLAPGGRAYVTTPAPTPFFGVMDSAFSRHGAETAASFVRLVFSLNEARELDQLLHDAGFSDVRVRVDVKQPRLPGPRDFFWQYVDSTPMAAALRALDEERRSALERDVVQRWQPWTSGEGLTYSQPILVGAATR